MAPPTELTHDVAATVCIDHVSDHPPVDVVAGQELALKVYHAITQGPLWEKSLLLIVNGSNKNDTLRYQESSSSSRALTRSSKKIR